MPHLRDLVLALILGAAIAAGVAGDLRPPEPPKHDWRRCLTLPSPTARPADCP
jgi:hypothetical protein